MGLTRKRTEFLESYEGREIIAKLTEMAGSTSYHTASSYSTDESQYPDNQIPFVDKHLNYLINHPNLDASKYVANLKLMARVR